MAVKVSIITPALNASQTIEDTLISLLGQTHQDWEAIVVNDGSTDHTADIVREFIKKDSRIRLIEQPQSGIAAARNAALSVAKNDWLLFLDADDWISPAYLSTLTNEIVQNPELDAVFCRTARVAGEGTLIPEGYVPPSGDLFSLLAYRSVFALSACIVRKSLVDAVGRFDVSHKRSVDWDLWQRVARMGARFGSVPELFAFYRMSPHGATLDACQMFKDGLRIIQQGHAPDSRVPDAHPDHVNGEPPELIPTRVFYLLSWCAGVLLGSGRDTKPLMDLVRDYQFPELYPDAVAQCIFDSAPLPNCQPPSKWEELGPKIFPRIDEFFIELEKQSLAVGLARTAGAKLRKIILDQSPSWSPTFHEYEEQLQHLAQDITELRKKNNDLVKETKELERKGNQLMQEQNQLTQEKNQLMREKNELLQEKYELAKELEKKQELINTYDVRDKILRNFEKQFWFRLALKLHILDAPRKFYSGKRLIHYLEFFKWKFSRPVAILAILVSVLYATLYQLGWISPGSFRTFGFVLAAADLIIATSLLIKPRMRLLAPTLLLLGAQLALVIFMF